MDLYDIRINEDKKRALRLTSLFEGFGYRRFYMRRFEEYAFYLENRNFLADDRLITFTDGGRLLALRPDVTLSIIKNTRATADTVERIHYRENVFRYDRRGGHWREISQLGIELLGRVDDYCELEVCTLALESLAAYDGDYVLDISHMGALASILEDCGVTTPEAIAAVKDCIERKSLGGLGAACATFGISDENRARLEGLISLPNDFSAAARELLSIAGEAEEATAAARSLARLGEALTAAGLGSHIRLDFSAIGDFGYYNGILLRGYVSGAPDAVLTGGRYDGMAGKLAGVCGIGFALRPGDINRSSESESECYLLYGDEHDPAKVLARVKAEAAHGRRVVAVRELPPEAQGAAIITL